MSPGILKFNSEWILHCPIGDLTEESIFIIFPSLLSHSKNLKRSKINILSSWLASILNRFFSTSEKIREFKTTMMTLSLLCIIGKQYKYLHLPKYNHF